MHAVAAFLTSIIATVGSIFAPLTATFSPATPPPSPTQTAAAAAPAALIAPSVDNATFTGADPTPPPSAEPAPQPVAQSIINQPVIERIIERIVPQGGTISADTLSAILADFERSISARLSALNPPSAAIPAQVAAGGNGASYSFFPASQRIDQLTSTAINTPTITGGTISGANVSGYLPLSGGTLTGALYGTDLSLSGTLTADMLSVGGLSSSGALSAPYFTATSTTATSTFAGGIGVGTSSPIATLGIQGSIGVNTSQLYLAANGNVGIGTTSPGTLLSVQSVANFGSATTSFYSSGGINIASGCFAINGACINGTAPGGISWPWTTATTFGTSTNATTTATWYRVGLYASSTSQFDYASSTALSTATLCLNGDCRNAWPTGGNAWPFTADSYNGIANQSTTSTLWLKNASLIASTTFFTNASTTNLTFTGPSWFTNLPAASLLALDSNNQLVATTSIGTNLLTGMLAVTNGGTGSTTLSGLLKGNGASALQTAVSGVDYEAPLSFSAPLSRFGNAVSLSTAGDWSGTLSGFSAAQLIAAGFSTTSADVWKSARNFFATSSTDYWLGTKTTDNLAQGPTNKYYATSLFAADLAATTTDALDEGAANLYFTSNRVAGVIAGTTTGALAEGSNLYFTNARADARINATSTIGTLTSAPNLTTVASSLSGFLKATAGVLATSLIDLTSDVTGILPVSKGGTGWAALAAGAIPFGNGSGALSTTTAGTAGQVLALLNGVPTWTATTTFSAPLSYAGGAVSLAQANASTNGYLASGDWTAFNSKVSSTSLSATYPLAYNSATGVFSTAFSTTTANSFSALQTFANASSSLSTFTGPSWFTNLPAASLLALDSNNQLVATTSIGTNLLTGMLAVTNGGTGASNFGQGWIYSGGGTTALAASTSPTVDYLTATSTTATSTFAGGLTGPGNFIVQSSSGRVGIGTTSPASSLDVNGQIWVRSNAASSIFFRQDDDNLARDAVVLRRDRSSATAPGSGFGPNLSFALEGFTDGQAATGGRIGSIWTNSQTNDTTDRNAALVFSTMQANTLSERVRIDSAGNVGIGTTSPTAQLSTTGTVRFSNFGAGSLQTDANGNVSVSSDERLKNIAGAFEPGLAAILQLNPIRYQWKPETGFDIVTTYAGFSAQNVQTAIPEAVGTSPNGYLSLSDRPILAALVNAMKELAQQVSDLAGRVVTKELVAVNGSFHRVNTGELCVDDVCVTREQFAAMVAAAGQSAGSPSPTPSGTLQAPVIEINGNATSTIEIGDAYNDLGARILAPESDLNLGIVTLLDGATTTAVSIDTTQPGEHTILYTVTSPTSGLTGNAVRTIIVSPAGNDNPFNLTTPANDNASSTPAAANI